MEYRTFVNQKSDIEVKIATCCIENYYLMFENEIVGKFDNLLEAQITLDNILGDALENIDHDKNFIRFKEIFHYKIVKVTELEHPMPLDQNKLEQIAEHVKQEHSK